MTFYSPLSLSYIHRCANLHVTYCMCQLSVKCHTGRLYLFKIKNKMVDMKGDTEQASSKSYNNRIKKIIIFIPDAEPHGRDVLLYQK